MIRNLSKDKVKEMPPLALAYVGDSVYEVMVRCHLVAKGNWRVNELHKKAVDFVKADKQAEFLRNIDHELDEIELSVVRRGRNAKSTTPKSANMSDYKYSTGFEALIGYLYLMGKEKRIEEIFELILRAIDEGKEE